MSAGSGDLHGTVQCSPRTGEGPSRSPSPWVEHSLQERGHQLLPPPLADPVSRDTPSLPVPGFCQGR